MGRPALLEGRHRRRDKTARHEDVFRRRLRVWHLFQWARSRVRVRSSSGPCTRAMQSLAGGNEISDQFSNLGSEPRAFLRARRERTTKFSCTHRNGSERRRGTRSGSSSWEMPCARARRSWRRGHASRWRTRSCSLDCLSSKALPEAFTQYEARRRPRVGAACAKL